MRLRNPALPGFAIFQTIGWAMFALTAGRLAMNLGIQDVFLWVLVVLMVVNGLVLTALYFTYPRDARRVTQEIEHRQAVAHAHA